MHPFHGDPCLAPQGMLARVTSGYSAVLRSTLQSSAVLRSTLRYAAVLWSTAPHDGTHDMQHAACAQHNLNLYKLKDVMSSPVATAPVLCT